MSAVTTIRSVGTGLLLALTLTACATKVAAPLADHERARLGRIGLVVTPAPADTGVAGPTPLGGFGGGVKGAAKGIGVSVASGAACFVTLGYFWPACVSAVMTPYWIGRGAVEGALAAVPERERRTYRAAIDAALAATDPDRVARTIETLGRERGAPPVVVVPAASLDAATEHAAAQDVDTLADVALVRVALERERRRSSEITKLSVPDVDPLLGLVVEARLRLIDARTGARIFERTYARRTSPLGTLAYWGGDDARLLRAERDTSLDDVADQIATDLFGERR